MSSLLSIQFHARPDDTEVGAVITFADSRQVMEHIRRISGWPEFKALLGVAKPVDVRVYGRLGEEAQAWLRTMNVVSKVFESPVAGFVHPPEPRAQTLAPIHLRALPGRERRPEAVQLPEQGQVRHAQRP
ncbi:hypothetical protein [Corallococcus exiguus]|uniref:hypothetical protein n=1 Tax=Corallococcus exiguus TaxID=83462 RepID=UPI003D2A9AED